MDETFEFIVSIAPTLFVLSVNTKEIKVVNKVMEINQKKN
jgi:hypothetical protein